MPYTPENNPLIPGDPYSYDLKWMVNDINYMEGRFTELDSQVQEATDQADRSRDEADRSRDEADRSDLEALKSEGYARGTQDGDPVSADSPYYENNSEYFKDESAAEALVSEGYASGEQNGVPVSSGSPYYENNAKYYRDDAADYAAHIADPVAGLVTTWLNDHITQPSTPPIDTSLTVAGAAADAKAAGDAIAACVKKYHDIIYNLAAPYDDLDTLEFNSVYTFAGNTTPANAPDGIVSQTEPFSVLTFTASQYSGLGACQILITSLGKVFERANWSVPGWSSWNRIDTIGNRYVEKKARIEGILYPPMNDLDTVEFNTIYTYSSTPQPANTPADLAGEPFSVFTFTSSQYSGIGASQLAISKSGKLLVRGNWSGDGWSSWHRCDNPAPATVYAFTDYIKKPFVFGATKTAAVYGDSIPAGSMGGSTTPNGCIVTLMNKLGITSYVNRSISGGAYKASDPTYEIITQMTGDATGMASDYIFVMAGTNDYGRAISLTDFRTNVQAVITYLQNNTSAEVFFITPTNRTAAPYTPNSNPLDAYSEIIMCEALTAGYNVIIGKWLGFPDVAGELDTTIIADGLHPNQIGHDILGQNIYNKIA